MRHPGNNSRDAPVLLAWLLPFLRATGTAPHELTILADEGVTLEDFATPGCCVRQAALSSAVEALLERAGERALGLHAGRRLADGDLGPVERALRSCATLRAALSCAERLMKPEREGVVVALSESEQLSCWTLEVDGAALTSQVLAEFFLTAAVHFVAGQTVGAARPREVHMRHAQGAELAAYEAAFAGAELGFGMPSNALIYTPSQLDLPLARAHPALQPVFEQEASSGRDLTQTVGERVRLQLRRSRRSMQRTLHEQRTSYEAVLRALRFELALRYLSEGRLPMSEIGSLLGYESASAFTRAFKRWSGSTPSEYAAQYRSAAAH